MTLALGGAQLGLDYGISNSSGKVSDTETYELLNLARQNNITFIDTAQLYGDSEHRIGALENIHDDFDVISKLTHLNENHSLDDIFRLTEQSLDTLKAERLYGMMFHRMGDLLPTDVGLKRLEVLANFKAKGRIQKVGTSLSTPEELALLIEHFDADIVQYPANAFDQRFQKSGLLDKALEKGMTLFSRSIFLQGFLLMDPSNLPTHMAQHKSQLLKFKALCHEHGLSDLEGALAYKTKLPKDNNSVIGVCNPQQLQEVIEAAEKTTNMDIDFSSIATDDVSLINPSNW